MSEYLFEAIITSALRASRGRFAHLISDAYSVFCCVNCEIAKIDFSVLDASSAPVVAHSLRAINAEERPGYKDASVLVNLIIP